MNHIFRTVVLVHLTMALDNYAYVYDLKMLNLKMFYLSLKIVLILTYSKDPDDMTHFV